MHSEVLALTWQQVDLETGIVAQLSQWDYEK